MLSRRKSPSAASRPLADLIGAAIDPMLARRGFSQSDIILYWDELVGERLAAYSQPLGLRWPPRGRNGTDRRFEPATLVVRVESGFALELQHLAALVIERINTHLGFACVARLVLKQGPLERGRQARPQRPKPGAPAIATAAACVGDIAHEPLRRALIALGSQILQQEHDGSL